MTWNSNVPASRRYAGVKTVGRAGPVTHVVCHITGTNKFDSVKAEFLSSVSAHYVVDKEGLVHQFVEEENQAWHAGIKAPVMALYDRPGTGWRKVRYNIDGLAFPPDTVWLDDKLQPVQGRREAAFGARPDGSDWDYGYFDTRWGAASGPVNYLTSKKPNAYSVGIEILSVGAASAKKTVYTDAMYAALTPLVTDICTRHGIPQTKGRVVGHEDVNPVQRWGWDPNQGFDWSKVWTA